jgi:uncharacterized protein YegL
VKAEAIARQPASVLLLVDVSGSMYDEPIARARSAIKDFITALDPADRVAVMSFATTTTLLQNFTADRALQTAAVDRLEVFGNTALYDAVIAGSETFASQPLDNRLVVLLSDGTATLNFEKRQRSLDAATSSGASFVAVGLGVGIDREYLGELTGATNGRLIEAPTPAALDQAYRDLATSMRSQYRLTLSVPESIDRTVPGTLRLFATIRSDAAMDERQLEALAGSVRPPFALALPGLAVGQRLASTIRLQPESPDGRAFISVEYLLDGEVIHSSQDGLYDFDPAAFGAGSHVLTIRAFDATGGQGETTISFIITNAAAARSSGGLVLLGSGLLLLAAAAGVFVYSRRPRRHVVPVHATKPGAWTGQRELAGPALEADSQARAGVAPKAQGYVTVLIGGAAGDGLAGGAAEYTIFERPLTLGTGPRADLHVTDETGIIAPEEARLWVQRGKLVYHTLASFSSAATNGTTSAWQFIEDGEEITLGEYRLVFRLEASLVDVDDTPSVEPHPGVERLLSLPPVLGLSEESA